MSLEREYETMAINAMGGGKFDKDLCRRLLEERAARPNIQPLHDRVLVERIPEPEGLIVTPEKYKDPSRMAKVIAVGPGRWTEDGFVKTVVKPGDTVHLPGIAAKIPDWDGKEGQILIQEQDIGFIVG